ncbi:MAG TPA: acyltransferase family protein [Gemmatales bacterium]|nr:acyltransferase family protein [Gemmatales bacterium]
MAAWTSRSPTPVSSPRWGAFWKRRFVRLYPPYLAAMVLSLGVIALIWYREGPIHSVTAAYAESGWGRLGADTVLHLFMVHNLTADFGMGLGNGPLWSLGMEEQLYALYFVFLLVHHRLGWTGLLGLGLGVTVAWSAWQAWAPRGIGVGYWQLGGWHLWPFEFWLMWIVGALTAEAHAGRVRLPDWCRSAALGWAAAALYVVLSAPLWLLLVGKASPLPALAQWSDAPVLAGAVALASWTMVQRLLIIFCFMTLINVLVGREQRLGPSSGRLSRWLAWVGLFSYALYLTHVLVIAVAETLFRWHYVDRIQLLPWRFLLYPPLCLGVAWVFFKLVEERFLHQSASGSRASSGPASAPGSLPGPQPASPAQAA